ncbi:hypothetical protein L249_8313, partial [Ophiocordyceps polyrhachis-furcata BCC 54312]
IRLRLRLRQTPSLLQFPYCFFFPSRTPSLARFFRLLFSSSSLPSFSSLPFLPTAGPTTYRDDRNRVRIRIRTVGFYEKLRRHEARRPKTKDTIDWLEKHAFFCRKVGPGPGPGPDESIEHSYDLSV